MLTATRARPITRRSLKTLKSEIARLPETWASCLRPKSIQRRAETRFDDNYQSVCPVSNAFQHVSLMSSAESSKFFRWTHIFCICACIVKAVGERIETDHTFCIWVSGRCLIRSYMPLHAEPKQRKSPCWNPRNQFGSAMCYAGMASASFCNAQWAVLL